MAHCSPVFRVITIVGSVVLLFGVATSSSAEELTPGGTFIDDDGSVFEPSIEAIFDAGITVGCSNRQQFCPNRPLSRGEFAALLARALNLPATAVDYFTDDNNSFGPTTTGALSWAGTPGVGPRSM